MSLSSNYYKLRTFDLEKMDKKLPGVWGKTLETSNAIVNQLTFQNWVVLWRIFKASSRQWKSPKRLKWDIIRYKIISIFPKREVKKRNGCFQRVCHQIVNGIMRKFPLMNFQQFYAMLITNLIHNQAQPCLDDISDK